jgi:phage terminase large subunit GpA-like protein
MDCGAVVDWAERLDDPRNLSAVQAAMHAFYKYGAAGFAAEFQNEPLQPETFGRLPSADQIMQKANGYQRGAVPDKAIRLTAFIDPGDDYLTWLVCAWEANFTGAVIDFGTWPDQGQDFSKATVRHPLSEKYPGTAKEGAILAGLRDILKLLLARQFFQGDNPMQIGLCMVDTGYKPDVVHAALRVTRQAAARPSRGRGITAGKVQFDDYKRDRCREIGLHWWIPKDTPHAVIQIDTNFWKTFVHSRLATAAGDPGALTLFGQPEDHALLAAHILAEYYTLPKTEKDVTVQEWHQHVGRDNELFDCLVGAAAGAAKLGCSVITAKGPVRIIQTPAVPWRRQ